MPSRTPLGLLGAGALLLALLGAWLWVSMLMGPWRLASGMLEAQEHLNKAEKALGRGALKEARYRTLAGAAAVDRARAGLASNSPLLALARTAERVDRAMREVPHLVAAAEHSADAARGALNVAQNALRGPHKIVVKDREGDARIRLDRIHELSGVIAGILEEIKGVRRELTAVQPHNLPRSLRGEIADGVEKADEAVAALSDAKAGFDILPGFLGADEPRTYLVGMQNSAEQRGTGGAILQFALLSIADGRPELVRNKGGTVYNVDIDREPISIPLPEDAWYVRGIPDAQRFGNANWSPDWPSAAELTVRYGQASDPAFPKRIDGVIGVDPVVIQELMPGIGPFRIEAGHRMTAEWVVHFTLYKAYASYPNAGVRRFILRDLVNTFYEKLLKPAHPTALVKGMSDSLAHKHMQVWLRDPDEQAFIRRMDWDGEVEPAEKKDYFFMVEQNVGGNKLDYFDEEEIIMSVRPAGKDAVVTAKTRFVNGVFLPQPRWSLGDTGRRGALHRPMVNVYVPKEARFISSKVNGTRVETPPQPPLVVWNGDHPAEHVERGKKIWSATLLIPPQEQGSLRYKYRVPGVIRTEGGRSVYRIKLQRQPEVRPELMTFRFRLPQDARGVVAPGFERDGDELLWQRPLRKEMTLEVSWRS